MSPDLIALGILALSALAAAAVLASKLKAALAALSQAERRLTAPPPPPPPRAVESRREEYGLLWFPTLTLKDDEKTVLAASAGLPHCARCVRPLALKPGPPEEWVCASCSDRRAGTAADLQVTDMVVASTLKEHLARHPGWRAAPGVGPKGSSGAP